MIPHQLAIVIPAYRTAYLEKALNSIARQTDKRFTLYVGDDASPEAVEMVVKEFHANLPLKYRRFKENWGGHSLTKHWERCIAMSTEPWIWLFSDDDVMEPDCVASFYRTLESTRSEYDVYRFDTMFIDKNDGLIKLSPPSPQQEGWMAFAYFLLRGLRTCSAQEVIFSRLAYEREGGWVDFPLAWGSDSASQMLWAGIKGFHRIEGARVRWRWSGQNLSSSRDSRLKMTKVRASMQYAEWLQQRIHKVPDPSFPLPLEIFQSLTRESFVEHLTHMHEFFGPGEWLQISRFLTNTWGDSKAVNLIRVLKINLHAAYAHLRKNIRRD